MVSHITGLEKFVIDSLLQAVDRSITTVSFSLDRPPRSQSVCESLDHWHIATDPFSGQVPRLSSRFSLSQSCAETALFFF